MAIGPSQGKVWQMKNLIPMLVAVIFALLVGSLGCGSEAEQHYKKGISYGNRGQMEKAIEEYTKAIELNPEYAEAYYHRGQAYQENPDQAISDLSRAIELKPDYWEAYYRRGAAYLHRDEYDAAIADFSKVMELEYKGLPPLYVYGVYDTRGFAYLRKGEYNSAISDFSKVIELAPKDSRAYLRRGIAYMRKGEYNSAISDLDKAVELQVESISKNRFSHWREYADYYLYRGQAYQALGLKNEAIADFEKVLELATNPEWIQAAKQEIEELRTQSK